MPSTSRTCLEQLCTFYQHYYDIHTTPPACDGFDALAIYHFRKAHYIATRAHVLYATEQHEYIYCACENLLDLPRAQLLVSKARDAGLQRIQPHREHMCSMVTLVVLAESITDDARRFLKKQRYRKNFRFSFHGWMELRIAALDLSANAVLGNSAAKTPRKQLSQLFLPKKPSLFHRSPISTN